MLLRCDGKLTAGFRWVHSSDERLGLLWAETWATMISSQERVCFFSTSFDSTNSELEHIPARTMKVNTLARVRDKGSAMGFRTCSSITAPASRNKSKRCTLTTLTQSDHSPVQESLNTSTQMAELVTHTLKRMPQASNPGSHGMRAEIGTVWAT